MLAIWSLVPLPFLKPAWTSGSSRFMYCWSLAWRILSITDMWDELTLWDPMDCSPPGSFVHGILQARILECAAMPSSRESFWPRDLHHLNTRRKSIWRNSTPTHIRIINKLGIEGTYLNIYHKLTANITLQDKRSQAYPPKSATRQGCSLSQFQFS